MVTGGGDDREEVTEPSPQPPSSWRERWPTLLTAIAGLAATVAVGWLVYLGEVREVERNLDLAGQTMIESVHGELAVLQRKLGEVAASAAEAATDEVVQRALEVELAPHVDAVAILERVDIGGIVDYEVGHVASRPNGMLPDPGTLASEVPGWRTTLIRAVRGRAQYLNPLPGDPHLVVLHPFRPPQGRVVQGFLVAEVEVATLLGESHLAEEDSGPVWAVTELAARSEITTSERLLHKEYLFLGDRIWQLSLEPRAGTVYEVETSVVLTAAGLALLTAMGVTFVVDVAARRRRFRARLAAAEAINAEKDRFLLTLSHQIRTPLTAVVGFLNILRTHEDLDGDERREFLERATDQADEVVAIVHDILVAARDDLDSLVVTAEPTNPIREANAVLASVGPIAARVSVHPDVPRAPIALADPIRVRQVLRNLITNAVRYGGGEVNVSCHRLGDSVIVTVADDGPGLPQELSERLAGSWQPVATEQDPLGTLGLGLRVAVLLAERMGGSLAHRRQDGFTIFELSLPAWEEIDRRDAVQLHRVGDDAT